MVFFVRFLERFLIWLDGVVWLNVFVVNDYSGRRFMIVIYLV